METTHTTKQIDNLQFLADHSGKILIVNPKSNAFFPVEMMRLALHYGHAHDRYDCVFMECDMARGTVVMHGNLCSVEIGLTSLACAISRSDANSCFELSLYSASCLDNDGDHSWLGVGQFTHETEALAHAGRALEYFDRALEAMHSAPTTTEKERPQ